MQPVIVMPMNDPRGMAELPLLRDTIQTQEVDWLAWEDPFITGCEAHSLREAREQSREETRKRLGYVIRMLELLYGTPAITQSQQNRHCIAP